MKSKRISMLVACVFITFMSLADTAENASLQIIPAESVEWGYLNPLRGALSPGAANLWGNRTQDTATGMLVRFKQGFASPPHIHNISYRGIVIRGLMHNAEPAAERQWLPTGSFWTQPAGDNHITAANGKDNLIYLEIDHGPYLVKPTKAQFNNGETPLNLHADNMVWRALTPNSPADGIETTSLWGYDKPGHLRGVLVKLPSHINATLSTDATEFKTVVIDGNLIVKGKASLAPGSMITATGQHNIAFDTTSNTLIYIRTDGKFSLSVTQ